MSTKFDARQTISRDALAQLATSAGTELDNLLRSINAELTPPLVLSENAPADLIVNIGAISVTNPETGRQKSITPISNIIPTFAGGTVTLDATGAGNATPSSGSAIALGMSASQFLKIGISLDANGDIVLQPGTAGASEALATNPPIVSNTHAIGYIVVETDGSNNVQNIEAADVFQYFGSGGGSGSGDASSVITRLWDTFDDSIFEQLTGIDFSSDGTDNVDGSSTGSYSLVSGSFEFSGAGQTLVTTNLLSTDEFITPGKDIGLIQLSTFWTEGQVDTAATYEFSVDGIAWNSITMERVGNSTDTYIGTADASDISQTLLSQATSGASSSLEPGLRDALAQSFTPSSNMTVKEIELSFTKAGSPTGNLVVSLRSDNAGNPGAVLQTSSTQLDVTSFSTSTTQIFEFASVNLTSGTQYWIVVEGDATYNSSADGANRAALVARGSGGSGFETLLGATWSPLGGFEATYEIIGVKTVTSLQLRITSSAADKSIAGYGLFYEVGGQLQSGEHFYQEFSFNTASVPASFALNWNADPEILNVRLKETGQSLSPASPGENNGFTVTGSTLTFPTGIFDQDPATDLTLVVSQGLGTVDKSSDNASKISNQAAQLDALGEKSESLDTVSVAEISVPNTQIIGRAPIKDLSKLPAPKLGIERISTTRVALIEGESGPNGEPVYSVESDDSGRIRLYGNGIVNSNSSFGIRPDLSNGDFIEIVFYGTGLNFLTAFENNRDFNVSIDGGPDTLISAPSDISPIRARNYTIKAPVNVATGLAEGLHTIRIAALATVTVEGFEILNESTQLQIPAGNVIRKDELLSIPATSTDYNTGFDGASDALGTKGGHVVVYSEKNGTTGVVEVKKRFKATDVVQNNLGSTDHSNEELVKKINWREFGADRGDDFSTLTTTISDRAFTLDDGTTTLVGDNVINASDGGFDFVAADSAAAFLTLSFVGTGLDIIALKTGATMDNHSVFIDGVDVGTLTSVDLLEDQMSTVNIVSGLPYGTHTVKIERDAFVNSRLGIQDFLIYGPAKPSIPADAVELGSYNLMADFVVNTTAALNTMSTGVLRKTCTREFIYSGSWSMSAVNQEAIGAFQSTTGASGAYVEYTFFGTGFDARFFGSPTLANDVGVSLNGTPLTSTNFSGASFSTYGAGIGFNSGTGVLDISASSATIGCGFTTSGLPLDVYTLRFTNNAALVFDLETIDVITPIHVPDADRNLLPPLKLVGSNSLRSELPLANYKQEKQHFVGGVDLGPNKIKWRRRNLQTSVVNQSVDVSTVAGNEDFKFDNLKIGKTYRISIHAGLEVSGSSALERMSMIIFHGGNLLTRVRFRLDTPGAADTRRMQAGTNYIFTATATNLRFNTSFAGTASLLADGTSDQTYIQLEELPNHIETDEF